MASTGAAVLLVLALVATPVLGRAQARLPLSDHVGEAALQAFVPQEPAALTLDPAGGRVDRQSEGGFSPPIPDFRAGAPLPGEAVPVRGARRRFRRQIAQKLRDMLTAPYSGRLPSDLQPLMHQSLERAQHVQRFNANRRSSQQADLLSRPAFQPGPQPDPQIDRLAQPSLFHQQRETVQQVPTQQFQSQRDFRPQQEFHQQQEFHPQQQEFHPQQQEFHPQQQDFHPQQQEFHPQQQRFDPDESFRRDQDFRPEPEFSRRPRPARRPQSSGFVPENGGLPTRLFGQIRRTFFGDRTHRRHKRSPAADERSDGFFQMPPGFPNMQSLHGFSNSFQDDANAVNNIDVPLIQFPQSPFEARLDKEQPVFQEAPGRS